MDQRALVVFSHLRWDFVYQRPQHLLSRLAGRRRVFFIEEPLPGADAPAWERTSPAPGVTVCRPRTTAAAGFSDDGLRQLSGMLGGLFAEENLTDYVLWSYTPMALPLAEHLTPRAVIYDCMDELSAFLHAPPELLRREAELLLRAD